MVSMMQLKLQIKRNFSIPQLSSIIKTFPALISKDKTRIKFLSYPIKGRKQPEDNNSSLTKVESQDQEVIMNVQKGIKSNFYNQGRYSVKHEKGIHYFHQLLCKYLN